MRKWIIVGALMATLFNVTSNVVLATESTSTESNSTNEMTDNQAIKGDFHEVVLPPSTYPGITLPSHIDKETLYEVMTAFYKENYTQEEINNSQQGITQEELEKLTAQLEKISQDTNLQFVVDQVEMDLNSDHLNIPRIIVLKELNQALKQAPDHDADLLLTALSELGNRIIMIGYYDEATKQITPLHLTNRTKPLFYYAQ